MEQEQESTLICESTSNGLNTSRNVARRSTFPCIKRPITRRRPTVYPDTQSTEIRTRNPIAAESNVKELFMGSSNSSESDIGLTASMDENLNGKQDIIKKLSLMQCVICGDEDDLELHRHDNFCIIALKQYWQKMQLPNPHIVCETCHILLKQLVEFVEMYKKLYTSYSPNKTTVKDKCMLCFKNKEVLYSLMSNQEHLLEYFKTVALIMWMKVHPLKVENRKVCVSCIRKLDIFTSLAKKMARINGKPSAFMSIDNLPVDMENIGKLGCKFQKPAKMSISTKTTVRLTRKQEQEATALYHMYDSFDEEDDYKELIVVDNCLDPHDYKKVLLKMSPAYRNKNIIEDLMRRIANNDPLLCESDDPIVTYNKKHNLKKTIFLYHRSQKLWYEALLSAIDRLKFKNMSPAPISKPMDVHFPPVKGASKIEKDSYEGISQELNRGDLSGIPFYEATLAKLPNIAKRLMPNEIRKNYSTPAPQILSQKKMKAKVSRPKLPSISSQSTMAKILDPTHCTVNPNKKLPDIKKKAT